MQGHGGGSQEGTMRGTVLGGAAWTRAPGAEGAAETADERWGRRRRALNKGFQRLLTVFTYQNINYNFFYILGLFELKWIVRYIAAPSLPLQRESSGKP